VLTLIALGLTTYLSWHYIAGGSMIGCGSGCGQVLNSRWSTIGGVLPVSGLAAGVYLAMLVASLFLGPGTDLHLSRLAWGVMVVLAGAIVGSAVWFTVVQKWIIRAFCPYCMAAHLTGVVLASLVMWKASGQSDLASRPTQRYRGYLLNLGLACAGLGMAGGLAILQVWMPGGARFEGGQAQDVLPAIDPHHAPLLGSPDAPYIVTLLFDYKCPHCQRMHFMLDQVISLYDGKLAFVLCPTPLDSSCNPYVARDLEVYKDCCQLAKIGLAVWLARPEAFSAFNRWMFSFESGDHWKPRSVEAAKAKAVELVGKGKLEAALADPWIELYLQQGCRIFGQTGGGGVPKLVFGSQWIIPEVYDAEELVTVLHTGLSVPGPSRKEHCDASTSTEF
jgi:uncharacterized membrane protein/protein-disulfide isomerase